MEHPRDLRRLGVDDYLLTIAEMNPGPNRHRMKATCVSTDTRAAGSGPPVNCSLVQMLVPQRTLHRVAEWPGDGQR